MANAYQNHINCEAQKQQVSEVAVANGKHASEVQMTDAEYKALCKRLRAEQRARSNKPKKQPQAIGSVGNLKKFSFDGNIAEAPINWSQLERGDLFSLDASAVQKCAKVNEKRALNLSTGKFFAVGTASCYRMFI